MHASEQKIYYKYIIKMSWQNKIFNNCTYLKGFTFSACVKRVCYFYTQIRM